MAIWRNDKLPVAADADLHGMVLWGKQAGLLMHWKGVKAREYWAHSSAWNPLNTKNENDGKTDLQN